MKMATGLISQIVELAIRSGLFDLRQPFQCILVTLRRSAGLSARTESAVHRSFDCLVDFHGFGKFTVFLRLS